MLSELKDLSSERYVSPYDIAVIYSGLADKDQTFRWLEKSHEELAEIVGEFVCKGSKVYVEGKLQTSSWEDRQSGEKKYGTEIVATDLVLLGWREKENGGQPTGSDQPKKSKSTDPAVTRRAEISDDDLPF